MLIDLSQDLPHLVEVAFACRLLDALEDYRRLAAVWWLWLELLVVLVVEIAVGMIIAAEGEAASWQGQDTSACAKEQIMDIKMMTA